MWLLLLAVFIIQGSVNLSSASEEDVKLTVVLFRHGDRTPVELPPKDPYNDLKYWPEDWGQLTDVGKRQHFQLGKYLRQRYSHLLSDKFDAKEIYIRSSSSDRALMSAQANLAGLYYRDESKEWEPNLRWWPAPIHSTLPGLDDLIIMDTKCPLYDMYEDALVSSDEWKEMNKLYQPIYDYISEHIGQKISTLIEANYVYSNLFIEELNNLTLPEWTKEVYPSKLESISSLSFTFQTFTPSMARLLCSPFIKDVTSRFENGTRGIGQKVVLYSGHDITIANVLHALGMFKPHNPEFAAHVFFELVKGKNDWFVRVVYQNNTLTIPNCGKMCPLNSWKKIYSSFLNTDRTKECGVKEQFDLPFLILLIFSFITITLFLSLKINTMNMRRYQQRKDSLYIMP